jgi:hypothetical protein
MMDCRNSRIIGVKIANNKFLVFLLLNTSFPVFHYSNIPAAESSEFLYNQATEILATKARKPQS